MYYTIYKITNIINNKIYIGCHKTEDINDDYMGSGTLLKRAIEKHGIENFTKEILHVYDTPEEMFEMESVLVSREFVADNSTYNIKVGGHGGWDYINENCGNQGTRLNRVVTKEQRARGGKNTAWRYTEEGQKHYREWAKQHSANFLGKKHTEETKASIGKKNSLHQTGEGNSQFGSMWITDGVSSRKIKKTELIPDGWYKGRVISLPSH